MTLIGTSCWTATRLPDWIDARSISVAVPVETVTVSTLGGITARRPSRTVGTRPAMVTSMVPTPIAR
ncbi:hypothetical protein AAFP35_15000 [Gordonia sp. CPCC 206044]